MNEYASLMHGAGEVESVSSMFQRALHEFQDAWEWVFGLRGPRKGRLPNPPDLTGNTWGPPDGRGPPIRLPSTQANQSAQ